MKENMRTGNLPANMKKARVIQIIPCKRSTFYVEKQALRIPGCPEGTSVLTPAHLVAELSSVGRTQGQRPCLGLETGILQIRTANVSKRKSFNVSACEIQILSKAVVVSSVVVLGFASFLARTLFWVFPLAVALVLSSPQARLLQSF